MRVYPLLGLWRREPLDVPHVLHMVEHYDRLARLRRTPHPPRVAVDSSYLLALGRRKRPVTGIPLNLRLHGRLRSGELNRDAPGLEVLVEELRLAPHLMFLQAPVAVPGELSHADLQVWGGDFHEVHEVSLLLLHLPEGQDQLLDFFFG